VHRKTAKSVTLAQSISIASSAFSSAFNPVMTNKRLYIHHFAINFRRFKNGKMAGNVL
jgi:hypothetical protein